MYLRHTTVTKNGKSHTYWRLVPEAGQQPQDTDSAREGPLLFVSPTTLVKRPKV
jgi:hypothetical protein